MSLANYQDWGERVNAVLKRPNIEKDLMASLSLHAITSLFWRWIPVETSHQKDNLQRLYCEIMWQTKLMLIN